MRLFLYGTLQVPEVWAAVVRKPLVGTPDRLVGYRRRTLLGRTYPGIVADPSAVTDGLVVDGVTDDEVVVLDAFEDEQYERLEVELESGTRAWAYVIAPGYEDEMSDEHWDLDDFVQQYGPAYIANCDRWRREEFD